MCRTQNLKLFESHAGFNLGHLIWDDFLPIFTLIKTFGMFVNTRPEQLMPLRYVPKEPLWATCDMNEMTAANCSANFKKFLPLMGIDPRIVKTTRDSIFKISDQSKKSRYICSPYGTAGLGMNNDHGMKKHGVEKNDYEYSFNVGKGPIFRQFRNYMMSNIGIEPLSAVPRDPFIITISMNSTDDEDRMTSFDAQIKVIKSMLQRRNLEKRVLLRTVVFKEFDIKEQIQRAMESSVIIGVCGGGAVTSMFMSDGGAMILYYLDLDVRNSHREKRYKYPARLDWDYFENTGNSRVHWSPFSTMNEDHDLQVLETLLFDEIELM